MHVFESLDDIDAVHALVMLVACDPVAFKGGRRWMGMIQGNPGNGHVDAFV
ncbi:MAG: hypothetical protein GYA24_19220 [Candidatus Lokiarchaeota archaeon]|nr:hypothetical protein [Candidatus Lokiarchaeota archaeon]